MGFCVRRLLKVFLKQKAGSWGQNYCDPGAVIYKQRLQCLERAFQQRRENSNYLLGARKTLLCCQ